ncbi:MAG TPA: hypothetical protein DDZ88_15455 [Verrucomicrobiales bacterium]|nr:hypothetical protein [Verrucomicrobiales bacterium]
MKHAQFRHEIDRMTEKRWNADCKSSRPVLLSPMNNAFPEDLRLQLNRAGQSEKIVRGECLPPR